MSRARLAGAALAIWLSATALLLTNTGGHALHEGDEAIYAEFAREMVATGHFGDLEWQREVQIVRPPLSVWVLVLGRGLFSDERAVRWPLAAEAAAEVALLFLLGAAIKAAQRVLDALHRPDRILRVQLRLVDPRSPDEQLRQAFFVGADQQRSPPPPAQDLETPKLTPHLQGQVVAP